MQRNAVLLARSCAVITAGLGLVAAVGWIARQPQLFRFDPAFAPVPFSVALVFVLVGAVLVLLTFGRRRSAVIVAAAVTVLGSVSALQSVVGRTLGLDVLFLEPWIAAGMPSPGRMAPNTALLFVFWGVVAGAAGVPALDRWRWRVAAVCGGLIMGYIVIVLIGYLGGVAPSDRWGRYASMAPQTAVGFLFAAAALICLAADHREPAERGGLPAWSAPTVGLALAACVVGTWQALLAAEAHHVRTVVAVKADGVANELGALMTARANPVERLAGRWETRGGTPREEFEADVSAYMRHQQDLVAINWIDAEHRIRWRVQDAGGAAMTGPEVRNVEAREAATLARRDGGLALTPPIELAAGVVGFGLLAPVRTNGRFDGFLEAVYRYDRLLEPLAANLADAGLGFSLQHAGRDVFGTAEPGSGAAREFVSARQVEVLNATWHLLIWPRRQLFADLKSPLPLVVLGLGLLSAFLAAGGIHYARRSMLAVTRTNELNDALRQEVDERARVAGEMDRLRQRMQLILDAAGEGIVGLNADGRTTFANEAAERLLGWTREEMQGRSPYDLIHHRHLDGTSHPAVQSPIRATLTEGRTHTVDKQEFWRKDGTSFPVEYVSSPVVGSDGAVEGAVIVFRDVTERKRHEADLKHANEELQATNRELEAFCYSVSHDLRTPLRTIDGFSLALLEDSGDSLDEEGRGHLDRIRAAATRMGTLIDDLLTLSRLTRQDMKMEPVDLSEIAHQVVAELRDATPDRSVEVEIADGCKVWGDRTLLRAVLQNLIGNAWKFTAGRDEPRIVFGGEPTDSIGRKAFFVQDNGTGFDMAYADKLFAPFQRLHRREEFEGTGVGLATVQRVIHRHGGRVWVDAEVDVGATFHFEI